MGERAGYRIKDGKETSWICRRQWYLGGDKKTLERMIKDVAENLMDSDKSAINDGGVALRDDLFIGRLFPALMRVICDDQFNSVNSDIKCDIDDHGLFEIEMVKWNKWNVNHYDTCRKQTDREMYLGNGNKQLTEQDEFLGKWVFGELQKKHKLGEVSFEKGKTLANGMKFKWLKGFKEY